MPSLRQKVTTYFRQLSFIADSRDGQKSPRKTEDDGNFITKYLEGRLERIFVPGPDIQSGKNPLNLPDLPLSQYPTGSNTITASCTGPDEGLTGIKRSKLHLSAGSDIDFIDTNQDAELEIRKSISNHNKFKFNTNSKYRSDQNANKTAIRSRKNSRVGSESLNGKDASNLMKDKSQLTNDNEATTIIVSMITTKLVAGNTEANKNNTDDTICHKPKTELIDIAKLANDMNLSNQEKENATPNTDTKVIVEKKIEDSSRLLREAVSNQTLRGESILLSDPIAGVSNWKMESDSAYGISISLYENNMLTKEPMGNPVADCYGIVARGNAAVMAMADGVNWGDGARLAARSAVHGCLDYLDTAIFGLSKECMASSTQEVFVSLLRSLWEGHDCILEVGGALSTLTVAVILPLMDPGKYAVCTCNVGDSLAYVYSKKHGVREITEGSHDITSMRDMRDALGALGPADGNKPELSNLTLSLTIVESGDIVFLTSDGISDNFDPVVGKFAEAWTPDVKLMKASDPPTSALATKKQNKSSSAIYSRLHGGESSTDKFSRNNLNQVNMTEPIPIRPPRTKKSSSPESNTDLKKLEKSTSNSSVHSRPKYIRSHTVIEPRISVRHNKHFTSKIPKSAAGLPLVTGPQRHTLTLLRLEDLLSYGINGTLCPCASARRLCHLLIDFVRMITSARRKTLEQRELFYKFSTGPDGIKREVEMNRMQHRAARKRIVDSSAFSALPGKLDHASVVAYSVGSGLQTREFQETNF